MEFWTAMEVSRRVVHKHWWSIFGLVIVNVLIVCVGALFCGVGVLVAFPVAIGAMAHTYERLFGSEGAPPPTASEVLVS